MSVSQTLFEEAQNYIPGGVNSPVRAFQGVGGVPVYFKSGHGAILVDEDGKEYIDYVGSWGPMIAGHSHPVICEAVQRAVANGLGFGAPTRIENEIAKRLTTLVPSMQQVRMVSSGTEATMSAIRLARGFTGRDMILKFEGCYHGHVDSLLVKAGSGALTLGQPSSPGIPKSLSELTLTVEYNNIDSVASAFAQYPDKIAAIIVEPVAGNMNCIPPTESFLAGLRALCDQNSSLLIFDEVMTGFRVALGGAQARYEVTPDLSTFGKVIGGGLPVGAFGGRKDIMNYLAPVGSVYQAGTLSGNPIALSAGMATLDVITLPDFYAQLEEKANTLVNGIMAAATKAGIPLSSHVVGGMFGLFFSKEETITRYQQVMDCNIELFKQFFHGMLQRGNYFAPSAFEAGFVSSAHTSQQIEKTIHDASEVFKTLA